MSSLTYGQTKLIIISGDTFALVPLTEIEKSYLKYLEYEKNIEEIADSLRVFKAYQTISIKTIHLKDKRINELNETINQLNKINKPKLLKAYIGGGFNLFYNYLKISDVGINLSGGVLIKEKYITGIQTIFTRQNIAIGFNANLIF